MSPEVFRVLAIGLMVVAGLTILALAMVTP